MRKKLLGNLYLLIIVLFSFIGMANIEVRAQQLDLSKYAGYVKNYSGEQMPWGGVYTYKCWSGTSWQYDCGTKDCLNAVPVTYEVTYNYNEAYRMIEEVNAVRKSVGVSELKTNDVLMQTAMERAAETALYWQHARPDGGELKTKSMFISGENISYKTSTMYNAKEATNGLVSSAGHYATMIDADYAYAGYGCVVSNNQCFWVQIFTPDSSFYEVDGYPNKPIDLRGMPLNKINNYSCCYTAEVNPSKLLLDITIESDSVHRAGDSAGFCVMAKTKAPQIVKETYMRVKLSADQYTSVTLTPDICRIKNGQIEFVKAGTAKIKVMLKADTSICKELTLQVEAAKIKNGNTITSAGMVYKVTDTKKATVSAYKLKDKSSKRVSIPDTVKIRGKRYKITEIAAKAFKNCRLTGVTIGKNVTKIGSSSFYGCRNLKKITVKSLKIKTVGKYALKGINKKAVIKVPKNQYTKYKRLFKKRGQKSTVKIKK